MPGSQTRFDYKYKTIRGTFFAKTSITRNLTEEELQQTRQSRAQQSVDAGRLTTSAQGTPGGVRLDTPDGGGGRLVTHPKAQDPS